MCMVAYICNRRQQRIFSFLQWIDTELYALYALVASYVDIALACTMKQQMKFIQVGGRCGSLYLCILWEALIQIHVELLAIKVDKDLSVLDSFITAYSNEIFFIKFFGSIPFELINTCICSYCQIAMVFPISHLNVFRSFPDVVQLL